MKKLIKAHRVPVIFISMVISIVLPFVMVKKFEMLFQTDNAPLIITVVTITMLIEIISIISTFVNFFVFMAEKSKPRDVNKK